MSDNTYTIAGSTIGFDGGRYKSKTPSAAAKKAGTRLFKEAESKKKKINEVKFFLRQTTRGSKHTIYQYHVIRKKLATPSVVTIGDKKIVYNFEIKVTPCQMSEAEVKSCKMPVAAPQKAAKSPKKAAKKTKKGGDGSEEADGAPEPEEDEEVDETGEVGADSDADAVPENTSSGADDDNDDEGEGEQEGGGRKKKKNAKKAVGNKKKK
jgi:hypothetical protein